MKYVVSIIGILLGLAFIAIFYLSAQKYIKQEAMDGCMQAGRLTLADKNVVVPENYWYQLCMKHKGYGEVPGLE